VPRDSSWIATTRAVNSASCRARVDGLATVDTAGAQVLVVMTREVDELVQALHTASTDEERVNVWARHDSEVVELTGQSSAPERERRRTAIGMCGCSEHAFSRADQGSSSRLRPPKTFSMLSIMANAQHAERLRP
jgi:hypothetical protein